MTLSIKTQTEVDIARAKIISLQTQQQVVEDELMARHPEFKATEEVSLCAPIDWIWDFLYNTPETEYESILNFCKDLEHCPIECEE